MSQDSLPFNAQDCLVAIMFAASISDAEVRTSELLTIQQMVNYLPIFGDYDADRIKAVAATVTDLFSQDDGIEALFAITREQMPQKLHETAYALACDVVAADAHLEQQELRFLEEIRYELDIDRLHAAAIERGARARHITL